MTIYQLPDAVPYATASSKDCNLVIESRQLFTTNCSAPAHLLRRELFYPVWHAQVNGVKQEITESDSIFQSIAVPAGSARISFYYLPDHTRLSVAASLLALGLWLLLFVRAWRRRLS